MPDLASKLQELARRTGDQQLACTGLLYQVTSSLFRGDRPGLLATIEAEEALARECRIPWVRAMPLWHRANLAVLEGRFTELRPLATAAAELTPGSAGANARMWRGMQLYVVGRHLGRLRVEEDLQSRAERDPNAHFYLAAIVAAIGDLDAARSHLDLLAPDDFGTIRRDNNSVINLALAADVAHAVGDRDRAGILYRLLLPRAGRHAMDAWCVSYVGSFDQRLGMLQSLLGDQPRAIAHLRDAAAACERLGAACFEAESRLHLASALAFDGPAHDVEGARREVDRALELARPRGMTPVVTEAEKLLAGL